MSMEDAVRELLSGLGEDPSREGLADTPARVAKSLKFLTQGYDEDPERVIGDALFTVKYDEMVIIRDIDVFSLCEHHMLPFFGKAHVAYLPNGKVVGLSKIPRLVDLYSRRLQVQERLTDQIAQALQDHLNPKGVGVVVRCRHMCMESRGVKIHGAETVTSSLRGALLEHGAARSEFMALAGNSL